MKKTARNYSSWVTILFTTLLVVHTLILKSQDPNQDRSVFYNRVMAPPSPNAASLGKYGEILVDKSTGIPSISIPLFTLNEGGISIPISLSYHAGGIKVCEEASWVGLGWALNVGGAITRSVRGKPDEQSGYLFNLIPRADLLKLDLSNVLKRESLYWGLSIMERNAKDFQPDIFYFNIGGESGTFLFDNTMTPRTIPYKDVKIRVEFRNMNINGFYLTDSNGLEYYFGDDVTGNSCIESTINHSDPEMEYTSSWYLRRIRNPLTGSKVDFEYESGSSYTSIPLETESITYTQGDFNPSWISGGSIEGEVSSTTSSPKYLTRIILSNGEVRLKSSQKEYGGRKLDSLILNNHFFRFYYSDFDNNTNVTQENSRLRFDSILETGGATNPKITAFDYSPKTLPEKNSKSIDHWGYYNGKNNCTLIPKYSNMGIDFSYGADRDANPEYAGACMLKRILYPTGGYTDFTFEGNDYYAKVTEQDISSSEQISCAVNINGSSNVCQETTINFDNGFTYKDFILELLVIERTQNQTNYEASVEITDPSGNLLYEGPITKVKESINLGFNPSGWGVRKVGL